MLRRLFGFDWRKSAAHLLLLSKFRSPRDPSHYHGDENWEAVLGERPKKAINRFLKDGMIREAELHGLLSHKYRVADLKPMLRERGLKVSGRKAELIKRLIEADPESMKKAVRGLHILQVTAEGEEVAEQYLEQKKEERQRVEHFVLQALKQRNFREASQAVAAYEAKQVFARGVGMDWENHDASDDVAMLDTIFSGRPKILKELDDEELSHLRIAAGMSLLWGTSRAKSGWLPEDFSTGLHFSNATAARMLNFYAYHRRDLEHYRGYTKTVEIVTLEDSSCDACQQLTGKRYRLDKVPELPYEKCTHKMGCRCRITPADSTDEIEANFRAEIRNILRE